MADSYWVVTDEMEKRKDGTVQEVHRVFGGRQFVQYRIAERFKDKLDCPAKIIKLDTVNRHEAVAKLKGMGVLKAVKEGRNWRPEMGKFRRGKVG